MAALSTKVKKKMETILDKVGLAPVRVMQNRGWPHHQYKILSNQIIGIEVEVENTNFKNGIPDGSPWQEKGDGSLRNNGYEFVSKPIYAHDAPSALQQLLVDILGEDCHFSPRTSVHIHLNVQDLTQAQVTDLVLVYLLFEKLFYRFAGKGRHRSIFCVPIQDTGLADFLGSHGCINHAWEKYTGLNLCPIVGNRDGVHAYGTVEFRHMHGTFDVEKLSIWIDLITSLKDYILKKGTDPIRELVSKATSKYDFEPLAHEVFGTAAKYLKYKGGEELEKGLVAAKAAIMKEVNFTVDLISPYFKFKG